MTTQFKTAAVVFAILAALCLAADVNADEEVEEKHDLTLHGWQAITDPDMDCQIGSKITITVPATNHDLNPRRGMNAPRLLKKVKGDFTVQVRVTGDFKPGDTSTGPGQPFNGAGLLIWENKNNFLRLERNAFRVSDLLFCYPPLIEYWRDGKYGGFNSSSTRAVEFFKGRSTWLKLRRQGERMTASFSHDGDEWTVAKEFTGDFPDEVSVGIAALNTSNAAFSVEFEAFEIKSECTAFNYLPADDRTDPSTKIERLADPILPKSQWKRAGFATPQKAAETFMWALREQDADCIRSCYNDPKRMEPIEFQSADSKEAGRVASALQPLAIRTVDERTVDLKFCVAGWGATPLSHRLKKVGDAWKFDSSSSTREADW